MSLLQSRSTAPDFVLPSTPDQKTSLSEFRGRNVVLVFYPADWSPVCSDELAIFNEILPTFKKNYDAEVMGLSVDGPWCHMAFKKNNKYHIPLLSDFEPKGSVAKNYGVYRSGDGVSERALYVIDKDGLVRWSYVSPLGVNPGADGVLDALESLSKENSNG